MANELRVFISSPGDVGREREIAGNVLRRLQGEYARRVKLSPYFWEYEPMRASTDYQGNIPDPGSFDIVICILWSRLGSRLNENYRHADGSPYASGTEYELELADEARKQHGTPDIYVYRNQQQPLIPIEPKEAREEKVRQFEALQSFLQRWFLNPDGTFRIASNSYHDLSDFEEKLEQHLRKIIEEKAPPLAASAGVPASFGTYSRGSPFRRLRSFEFEDAEIFFGRTKALDQVLNALQAQARAGGAFTLIFGGSGSGKSSLARAGVIPLVVRPGVVEGIGLWRWAAMRPSDVPGDIFAALAAAVLSASALPELAASTRAEDLAKALREAPTGVPLLIRNVLAQISRDLAAQEKLIALPAPRFLLLVDQLEELFTIGTAKEVRAAFIAALGALARSGSVWVLATLRSEFFGRCEEIPELMTLKSGDGQYQLARPSKAELAQIVRFPAIAAGLEFETDPATGAKLDDVLLDAASRGAGALPLIEFALDELYQRRRDDRVLTHAAFTELGGIEGALETAAEEAIQELTAAFPKTIDATFARVFRALVTVEIGEQLAFVRRIAEVDRIANTPEAQRFVQRFVDGWLLVTDRDAAGRAIVQVAHETLFEHWPRLQRMLEESRGFLENRARASAACARWRQRQRDRSLLWWNGAPLVDAGQLLMQPEELTPDEKEFATASVAEGAAAKRRRWLAIGAATLVALGAAVSGWLWVQKARAEKEVSALRAQLDELQAEPTHQPYAILDLTRRILAKVPGDSQAWARQAGAEIEVQDFAAFEAALAQWQQNVSPRPPEIDALRGDAEWMQSQREEAIKSWSAYLASAGRSLDERRATWRKLAGAHAELGQWKEARDRLTEWLSAEVTFEALIRRAAANRNLRDWDAARRDFEAAKNLNPSDPAVTNFGPLADAARLDELNARIEQAPRDPAAWLARATELARQRSFAAALEDIGHAQDLDPDALRLALERAHLLWQLGQPLPETPPLQPADDWTRDATKYAAAFSARQPLLEALSAADAHVKAAPATAAPYLERAAVLERLHQDAAAQADRQSASKF